MGASYYGVAALAEGYASGEFDPVAVTEAALEAARRAQDAFNPISVIDPDCLSAAEASRRRWKSGSVLGPLDGIPVTVKDSFCCTGLPRWHGSATHDGEPVSTLDSAPVQRLREAGAILVAKTTMPDFGMLASGISSQFGIIRNPWNPALSPGGSSSGAAVALATGVAPLAVGTDIAGSVRLPAAHCGLAAIKPTQGRVAYAPSSMIRSAGPMARRAADLETLLAVIGCEHASDAWCLPGRFEPATWGIERVCGMRIGVLTEVGYGMPADSETLGAVRRAADQLTAWGASVDTVRLQVTEADFEALDLRFRLRALAELASVPERRRGLLLDVLEPWSASARDASALDAAGAGEVVDRARDQVARDTSGYDAVLAPVLPVPTFAAESVGPCPGSPPLYHASYVAWFNQTGQPAASICAALTTEGMPIGLQIVGQRFRDADVLRLAVHLERSLAVKLSWPGLPEEADNG